MAKTYNTFTNVSTGDVYTAASHNAILQNLAGYRVPPSVRATRTTTQSITNNTLTTVTFPTEDFDTDDMHSTSANTERLTAQTAGMYLVTANVIFNNNGTGQREIIVWKVVGGVGERLAQASYGSVSNSVFAELSASAVTSLAVGDYVYCQAYQNSGGALDLRGDVGPNALTATWLGQVS